MSDQKPKAVMKYVNAHGSIVSLPPADPIGDLRRFHKRLTASGVTIATNKADNPIDGDKLREHMEGHHGRARAEGWHRGDVRHASARPGSSPARSFGGCGGARSFLRQSEGRSGDRALCRWQDRW